MEQEKSKHTEIEIIDEGTEPEGDIGPQRMCCWGAYSPMLD
ncbi:MAG: hypothetical protein ACOCR8_00885 [Desulfosalsimonas sp.]